MEKLLFLLPLLLSPNLAAQTEWQHHVCEAGLGHGTGGSIPAPVKTGLTTSFVYIE